MLVAAGCASGNIDSPTARANTGYADFYSPSATDLCWQVQASRTSGIDFKTVFLDVKPVERGVLRLAFAPGNHDFRITFLNRVIAKAAEVEIEIENGRITPVRVTLTGSNPTTVVSKQTIIGGATFSRGGRQTMVNRDETVMYELSIAAKESVPYRPKQQMPYAQ